jgi:hypothetical protein
MPIWYDYRVLGICPEVPEGHEFRSKIMDLENHIELWIDACPFTINPKRLNQIVIERA